jgi:hypothetical protein
MAGAPTGVNALYLSLELETALAEYQQLDALPPPGRTGVDRGALQLSLFSIDRAEKMN